MSMTTDEKTSAPPTWASDFRDRASEMLSRNSMILTGFLAAFIIFTGYTLIEMPQSWYVPLIALGVALVLFLVFVEARGFFKQVGAALVTLIASSISFLMASIVDPYTGAPLLWFASYWILFFGAAAVSYAVIRGRSRWGSIMFAEFAAFIAGYIGMFASLSLYIAAVSSALAGIVIFSLTYYLSGKSRFSSRKMPLNVTTEDITDNVIDAADESDWFARSYVNTKSGEAHYLVWDERAYLLVPVSMHDPFSVVGNRFSSGLGYKGRPINPWLVDLIYNKTPFWMSRSAPVMVILLDVRNGNGLKPRTIAASIPDSRHRVPVGILPARDLLEGKAKSRKLMERVDREFSKHTRELNDKQLKTLASITDKRPDSSEYISDDLSDEATAAEETNEDTTKSA